MNKDYMIAFVGYNAEQTSINFKTFVEANKDELSYWNKYMAVFKDGTHVFMVTSMPQTFGRVYDYIIISDDRRMLAMYNEIINQLKIRLSGYVPEEFTIIHDDIDDRLIKIF